jgi:histone acetyltransferase (RNA polymerase elongator complex component)
LSDLRPGRPLIVPVFLPFQGCPHRCVYCDQETITAQAAIPLHPSKVATLIEQAMRSPRFNSSEKPEVAFYGGTFTRLPKARMRKLLEAVAPYLKGGAFHSVRLSTRPDGLDDQIVSLLSRSGVETVELGAQSMDDEVLNLSQRGHSAVDTVRSVRLLQARGVRVGIQLMPGLPGDSEEKFLATVDRVIELKPDVVRLYPTVVIRGTTLAHWHDRGIYSAWCLEKAVRVCSESVIRFESSAIPVIRIGLMGSPSLREPRQVVAGPWHDAFGHMVRSSVYHRRIETSLSRSVGGAARIRLRVHPKEVPLMRGFKNKGIRDVELKTGAIVESVIPDNSISAGHFTVETP